MKLHEILNEAIEPKRDEYHKVLVDNKEKLQKNKTRIGVVRTLRRLFPDIIFKMFADRTASGSYLPEKKTIEVYNDRKLFSGKNVRNNWDGFVNKLVDTLTHENIHRDQYSRDKRDHSPKASVLNRAKKSVKNRPKYQQQWMDLNADLDDYKRLGDTSAYKKTQERIEKLVRKARKNGVILQTSARGYHGNRVEITAYAEQAAEDILKAYRKHDRNLSNEQIRKLAFDLLQREPRVKIFSSAVDRYVSHFEKDEKARKQFFKQVVRYIEMKTK